MAYRRACSVDDVWSGEIAGVIVEGVPVLLVRLEGELHAYEDRCAHQAVRLSEGRLARVDGVATLTCAAHGWTYDARTGCGINPPEARLRRLPLRVERGEILVDTDGARAVDR